MSGYQALLTDLDGTLIHSQDCICDALFAAFQKVSRVIPSKEQIMGMFGLPVEVMLTTLTDISQDDKETITQFIEEYKRQYPIHMEHARLIDGALETMQYIESLGCPICLITSERRKNAAHILKQMGLDRYIRNMVSRDDVTRFKPDPEPILKGAAACGMNPEDCVYIGESPFDIKAGVAAGVYTVAVPSGNWSLDSLMEQSPDCVVNEIKELCSIFDHSEKRRRI